MYKILRDGTNDEISTYIVWSDLLPSLEVGWHEELKSHKNYDFEEEGADPL
jgi:hypothetical protein